MTSIPIIHNGDLYRVYVDEFNDLVKIELYPENKNIRPEEIEWTGLEPELKERVTNKLMKQYGVKLKIPNMHSVRDTDNGRNASAEREHGTVWERTNLRAQQLLGEVD